MGRQQRVRAKNDKTLSSEEIRWNMTDETVRKIKERKRGEPRQSQSS